MLSEVHKNISKFAQMGGMLPEAEKAPTWSIYVLPRLFGAFQTYVFLPPGCCQVAKRYMSERQNPLDW